MNIAQIESSLQKISKPFNTESFIYDLLLAYGQPKASIKRLQQGRLNLSKTQGEILWKKKLFFKCVKGEDLHSLIDNIKVDDKATKQDPRFIIVTDFETLLAIDRKTADSLDIPIVDIAKNFDFFLPWAGMEKAQHQNENPADVKAAERMAKLYDEIKKDNPTKTPEEVHNLNVFLSRLLFCFFAEDTGIFDSVQFTNAISSHTQADGSDLQAYLDKLFIVLNTEPANRKNLPAYLEAFPYVNGGLFRNKHYAPAFTRKSRQVLIDSGQLEWKDINPDIFGSMIQAVITPEHRGGLGMHYTSVPNIMKVIEPLFLNELYEQFEAAKSNFKALNQLLTRLCNIKIFDPACGSGNFLIIAYKELRKLEMKIFKELDALKGKLGSGKIDFKEVTFSEISLGNFYGIEIDDFAHEVATLSLWLAEHQMNQEFFKEFGRTKPALPLKETGNIIQGNATRRNWDEVCPKSESDEIYILGNPPYLGFGERSKEQKEDMEFALMGTGNIQRLDYISCWFVKASEFIKGFNSRFAFVSTNSLCQGEQVSLIWPLVFSNNQEIFFAHKPFKWSNNAKDKAGVTCVILGVQKASTSNKLLFSEGRQKTVARISPYLIEGNSVIVYQRTTPLSLFPEMMIGSTAIDGGFLILSQQEKDTFINSNPQSQKFIKPFIGGGDFIDGKERFCLWIEDDEVEEALSIRLIRDRVEQCRRFRLSAGRDAKKGSAVPHRFFYRKHQEIDSIILPMTSSEKREYLQVGFLTNKAVVSHGVFVIYGGSPYIFGILSSKMHMCWTQAVSGKLESRIRYSVNLAYNSFPFPRITIEQSQHITQAAFRVLETREYHSEKTLAQMYHAGNMPMDLREAHFQLDLAIEKCYKSRSFESDEERLEYLFKLYEQMIAEEQTKGTLFELEKKSKKQMKKK